MCDNLPVTSIGSTQLFDCLQIKPDIRDPRKIWGRFHVFQSNPLNLGEIVNFPKHVQDKFRFWLIFRYLLPTHEIDPYLIMHFFSFTHSHHSLFILVIKGPWISLAEMKKQTIFSIRRELATAADFEYVNSNSNCRERQQISCLILSG